MGFWGFGFGEERRCMGIDEDAQLLESGATKLKCMYYKLGIGRGEGTIYFHWLFSKARSFALR
jgi:hypothetical protein